MERPVDIGGCVGDEAAVASGAAAERVCACTRSMRSCNASSSSKGASVRDTETCCDCCGEDCCAPKCRAVRAGIEGGSGVGGGGGGDCVCFTSGGGGDRLWWCADNAPAAATACCAIAAAAETVIAACWADDGPICPSCATAAAFALANGTDAFGGAAGGAQHAAMAGGLAATKGEGEGEGEHAGDGPMKEV